jgi:hypothetical protein
VSLPVVRIIEWICMLCQLSPWDRNRSIPGPCFLKLAWKNFYCHLFVDSSNGTELKTVIRNANFVWVLFQSQAEIPLVSFSVSRSGCLSLFLTSSAFEKWIEKWKNHISCCLSTTSCSSFSSVDQSALHTLIRFGKILNLVKLTLAF